MVVDLAPPPSVIEGIVVGGLPARADAIFSSIRHVLGHPDCLDEQGLIDREFITDAGCKRQIYAADGGLLPLRQLHALDIEAGDVTQLTNLPCSFASGQAVNSSTLIATAACDDTDANGRISDGDRFDLYVVNLAARDLRCLSCSLGLEAVDHADYSRVNGLIVFSARDPAAGFEHHLFLIDLAGNLRQITSDAGFREFGPSWAGDGATIVFSRRPSNADTAPSRVWTAAADGSALRPVTAGSPNLANEPNFGSVPIGLDADPDLSPDGTRAVISRLRTGRDNQPFGVHDLVIADIETGAEQLLDYTHANMRPEWGAEGILLVRQSAAAEPMLASQALHLYRNSVFIPLETFPYDVFPIGAFGGSWINPN